MPAPDYETIYDVEGAVEPAVKAVLQAAGFIGRPQRETADLQPVRVDIQFQLGQERDARGLTREMQMVVTAWNAQLLLRVITPRFGQPDTNGNPLPFDPAVHGRTRGKIRHFLQHAVSRFTAELLPYHVLTQIKGAGSSPQLELDDDQDVSELAYDCIVSVREGAWPLPPAP